MKLVAARRSIEATSWRTRVSAGTLSASSVSGPTLPVSLRPWRAWKRFTAAVTALS
jgi:hypothetical protein